MRYRSLDALRGIALVNMIIYHGLWDMVNIFGIDLLWFVSDVGFVWQQCICCTFILLSGFCFSLGHHRIKRGIVVLGCSGVITAVTALLMPHNLILFGILTFLGSAMLIMIPLDKVFKGFNPYIGMIVSLVLFVVSKNVALPGLTHFPEANLFTAYLGFPPDGFSSQDYFPIIPWVFLYVTGYFLYNIFQKHSLLSRLNPVSCKPLEWIGRHSLVIYMLHQPVLYGVLTVVCKLF